VPGAKTLVKCRVGYPLDFTALEGPISVPDLRPLPIGELLDRSFSIYRRNFVLFLGISAIPHLLVLAVQLARVAFTATSFPVFPGATTEFQADSSGFSVEGLLGAAAFFVLGLVVSAIAYLFSQGGTVFAVSELYLGRETTIGQSLRRVRGELISLFFVVFFGYLAIGAGFLFFFIPGVYLACRLCVCIPAALLENLGPFEAFSRSFRLTEADAGRAFLILLLYAVLWYDAVIVVDVPFVFAVQAATHNAGAVRTITALVEVGNWVANVLITPVFTIASAIFYFDLRVRKEGFDLQLMLIPLRAEVTAPPAPPIAAGLLS
jgi:hypothetical protein